MTETITGRLHFFSETGTEGGYWAIQDEKFITPPDENPSNKHCSTCNRWWGDAANTPEPPPSFTYYRPDRVEDGRNYLGGYFGSPDPIEGGQTKFRDEPDGSFNDEWTKRGNALSLVCYNEGHTWEWVTPTESWSYEGLHYISNGDLLEILDDDNNVVETINVELQSQDQYAEGSYAAGGYLAAHHIPLGVDVKKWESYFFSTGEKQRARLTQRI